MISRRALGVAGRLAWRLNIVRPTTQFSAQQSPLVPLAAFERLEKLQSSVEKLQVMVEKQLQVMEEKQGKMEEKQGMDAYVLSKLASVDIGMKTMKIDNAKETAKLNDNMKTLKIDNPKLNEQMKMQTNYDMEWYQRDLSMLAAEILKWSIGARRATGGDERHFYATSNQRAAKIGAEVFDREVEDFKSFSRLVILDRNYQVHFGSLKLLDERVEIARRYIRDFGSYLRVSREREVEVIDNYEALKEALPNQFH